MKKLSQLKILFSLFAFLLIAESGFAQFNHPILQFGMGIAEPMGDMRGTYYADNYIMIHNTLYPYLGPNPDLYTNNYGAKTGLSFFGSGKINFDKFGITRGVAGISFNTFNTFEPSKSGNIFKLYGNSNPPPNNYDTIPVTAHYNYTINTFSFNLGVEIAPTSFTNKVSPYFGARMTFNSFNTKLSYTTTGLDTTSFSTSDFRMGVMFDAGVEFKFNKMLGMVVGASYNLGNLLFKNTNSGYADNHEWGKSNSSMNDEAGLFYSSIYNPIIGGVNWQQQSKQKHVNWGTIYLGLNIYLGAEKSKKPGDNKK